jgi:hypothetical protein
MGRKAQSTNGQPRDAVIRVTENDKEFLQGIGEGSAPAGLEKVIRFYIDSLARKTVTAPTKIPAVLAPPQTARPKFIGKPGGLKSISSPTGPVTKTFRRG